jgi:hypothetical protein
MIRVASTITRADGSVIRCPSVMRRVWVPGIQYGNETPEQMRRRERRLRAADRAADAEQVRLIAWACRPWWA